MSAFSFLLYLLNTVGEKEKWPDVGGGEPSCWNSLTHLCPRAHSQFVSSVITLGPQRRNLGGGIEGSKDCKRLIRVIERETALFQDLSQLERA